MVVAIAKLAALDNRIKATQKTGYQPGSTRNLRSYINRYLDFCLEYKLHPIPADGIQIRRFVQYLADLPTILAIATIQNYIWGVRMFHKLLNLNPPSTDEFLTKLTIKGIRLALARLLKQAEPVTPEILYKIFQRVDINSDEQVAAWTAMLYAFHMLLHKSNLVPDTQTTFDPQK